MAGAEQVFAPTPIAALGGRVIASPFQFTATENDNLRVTVVNSVVGVVVAIQGLRLDAKGNSVPLVERIVPTSDRMSTRQIYKLGAGALLYLTVFVSAGAPLSGQTYVMVELIRGREGGINVLGTLLAGYVTAVQALGFPGSPIQSSLAGEPAIRAVVGTQPAAGANILETVPTGARWELLTAKFQFVTGGAAGARRVTFNADNAVVNLFQTIAFNTSGPGETWNHCFGPDIEGTSDAAVGLVQSGTPGRMIARAGFRFYTVTASLDAADQFGAPALLVREWLEVSA